MSFLSFEFAIFFFIFFLLYNLSGYFKKIPLSIQQVLLLCSSLLFYVFSSILFLPFLFYVIIISYIGGLFSKNRTIFIIFIFADLLPLLFFKYAPMHLHKHIIFPLGLSFFTFQSISYISDCYKHKIKPERNILLISLYISFFPVISSGPIQRANILIPQLKEKHQFNYEKAVDGLRVFAWGMFKKLCIANRISLYVNYVYNNISDQYGLAVLLATILYSFQIYFDFSGYSDMAIGISYLMGFDTGKNFDHPYLSQSISEFWHKWHISLSNWLRDYIYIPLGGSRVHIVRIYLNIIITFLVSGMWHGSTINFIIWGTLHGLYQCIERAINFFPKKIKLNSFINIFITFLLVTFAWIFFRAQNISTALCVLHKLSQIPENICELLLKKNEIGITESIRMMFSLYHESCKGFKGMLFTVGIIIGLIFIELFLKNENGLLFIKKQKIYIRWILYYCFAFLFCLLFIPEISSNFIYEHF